PGVTRDRHTFLCYWKNDAKDMTGHMELAFLAMREHADVYKRIRKAVKLGDIAEDLSGDELVKAARKAEVITTDEAKSLKKTEQLRMTAIGVDQFAPGVIEQRKFY